MADKKPTIVSKASGAEEHAAGTVDKIKLFKRKAMETRRLRDSFKFLDAIVNFVLGLGGFKTTSRPSWKKANEKAWRQISSNMFTWILMMVFHQQEANNINWSQLFYDYMKNGQAKSCNLLIPSKLDAYHEIILLTINDLADVRDSAEDLQRFFESHKIDPYSAIIGQVPSKEITVFSQNISDDCLAKSVNFDLFGNSNIKVTDYKNRYQDLVSRLVYWSSLPSEDALREVKQVAASIRGVSRLPTGSLVLVLVDDTSILHNESDSKQKWIYARVAGQSQGALVLLFTNPSETILESFPYDRVIPLAPEMERKYFKEPHPDQLFKCVASVSDSILNCFNNFCNKRIKQYFIDNNIEIFVLELAQKNQCAIMHQDILRAISALVEKQLPDEIVTEIDTFGKNLQNKFLENFSKAPSWELFHPTLEITKQTIASFDWIKLINEEFAQYQQVCVTGIADINRLKERLFNGERKEELVTAWLLRISRRVNAFLSQHGYELDAIPNNYLDQPPENIAAVRRNLVLLRRILNSYYSLHDEWKLKELIKNICESTYANVNSFLSDVNFCLAELLGSEKKKMEGIKRDEIDKLIKQKGFPPEELEKLEVLTEDKLNLQIMQQMENDIRLTAEYKMKIVPISGLVMSKFCRMENECKSVLDLWEPVRVSTGEDARSPLENAVIKQDMKQLDYLLKAGEVYVNEQDHNGWTALHLACSFCFNEHRLEVIEYLMALDEIDILLTNNFGNTPVHYFSRMPLTDQLRPKYRDLMIAMFKKGNNVVHAQNKKGETPLHHACLSGNVNAIRYLVEAGADPNCPNEDGSTPLHYAIQSTCKEGAEILLKAGANPDFLNKAEQSPKAVAIKLNLQELSETLHKASWGTDKEELASAREKVRVAEQQKLLLKANSSNSYSARPHKKARDSVREPPKEVKVVTVDSSANWKKAPIPDELRVAMMELVEKPNPNPSTKVAVLPPVPPRVNRPADTKSFSTSSLPVAAPVSPRGQIESAKKIAEAVSKQNEKRVSQAASVASLLTDANRSTKSAPAFDTSSNPAQPAVAAAASVAVPTPPPRDRQESDADKKPKFVRALWDVDPDEEDELKLSKGDIILVLKTDPSGWWLGQVGDRIGTFPENYTEPHNVRITSVNLDDLPVREKIVDGPPVVPAPAQIPAPTPAPVPAPAPASVLASAPAPVKTVAEPTAPAPDAAAPISPCLVPTLIPTPAPMLSPVTAAAKSEPNNSEQTKAGSQVDPLGRPLGPAGSRRGPRPAARGGSAVKSQDTPPQRPPPQPQSSVAAQDKPQSQPQEKSLPTVPVAQKPAQDTPPQRPPPTPQDKQPQEKPLPTIPAQDKPQSQEKPLPSLPATPKPAQDTAPQRPPPTPVDKQPLEKVQDVPQEKPQPTLSATPKPVQDNPPQRPPPTPQDKQPQEKPLPTIPAQDKPQPQERPLPNPQGQERPLPNPQGRPLPSPAQDKQPVPQERPLPNPQGQERPLPNPQDRPLPNPQERSLPVPPNASPAKANQEGKPTGRALPQAPAGDSPQNRRPVSVINAKPDAADNTKPAVSQRPTSVVMPKVSAMVTESFEAETPQQISLPAGAKVAVLQQNPNGWWMIRASDGSSGQFPAAKLNVIAPQNLAARPLPTPK